MTKASHMQTSFNAGQFSPLLSGRIDIDGRKSALLECKNLVVTAQGPATRRPGSMFVGNVKDSTKRTALHKFEFNIEQAYQLEVGDQYLRFFLNKGRLLETAKVITGVTQANPAVVSSTGHSFSNGDWVVIDSIVGMTELNNRTFKVNNVLANSFELQDIDGVNIDSTAFTAYTSGGTASRILEITTPYLQADLFDANGILRLKFTQSADVMYIVHPLYPPMKLERSGATAWALTVVDFIDGPYLPTNTTTTDLTPSALTGTITLTASSTVGINNGVGFLSTDVGRLVRLKDSAGNHTWAEITVVTTNILVTVLLRGEDLPNTTAITAWRLGLYTDSIGYPTDITFHENRLVPVGALPNRVDFSKSSAFENFATTQVDGLVADDNAFTETLTSDTVSVIQWVRSTSNGLAIGTIETEFIIRASNENEILTPDNKKGFPAGNEGSTLVPPVFSGSSLVFAQRTRKKLMEMNFVFADNAFNSANLNIRNPEITGNGVTELAVQKQPHGVIWARRADGALLGLTHERNNGVIGWHNHVMGGELGSGNAEVESVSSIPSTDSSSDELWMIVKRTINGVTRCYVEYLSPFDDGVIESKDFVMMDSSLVYSGAPITSLSGLDHLEGESVLIFADGKKKPKQVVTNGSIALAESASDVVIGLAIEWRIKGMRIEAGAKDGVAQGKIKRIHRVKFRFYRSFDVKYGPDYDMEIPGSVLSSDAPELFSGDVPVDWIEPDDDGADRDGFVEIFGDGPFPVTILAWMPQLNTQDES